MNRVFLQKLCRAAATLLCVFAAAPAMAVAPQPVGFELTLSCNPRVLDAIGEAYFMDVWKEEACDNPHLRVRNRNKPALMLTNQLDSVAPITSFTIAINEGPFVFGSGDVPTDGFTDLVKNTMYTDDGVTITGATLSADGTALTIDFAGFTAGKKAIFCVDLDSTDASVFPFPDFRNVLFGAPTTVGGDTTDAASYQVTFTGPGAAPNVNRLGGDFDVMTEVPTWQNDVIRPYIQMDPIEIITIEGRIPEPTAAMLALAGMTVLAGVRRRR